MARHLCLAGTPRDIGFGHGVQLSAEIAECITLYRTLFRASEPEILERAARFEKAVTRFAPDLAEEIEAIAIGSGQDKHWIYALNARSELMTRDAPECTAVFFPTTAIVGQTWDWVDALENLYVVLEVKLRDGRSFTSLTEPGIVGKIGLSSAGLGICLNFLSARAREDSVPIHILLRKLMEARSLGDAREQLRSVSAGQCGHILVCAADGRGISLELAGTSSSLVDLTQEVFVHTNHCLRLVKDPGSVKENSHARLATATDFLLGHRQQSIEAMRELLSDASHPDHKICSPYVSFEGAKMGTVATVIMDLKERRLHVRKGPRSSGTFEMFGL